MQKAILYLTIALVGVGLMMFVSEYVAPTGEKVYTDAASFNEELAEDIEAGEVPAVPACAETIEMNRTNGRIDALDFICSSSADQESFRAMILEEYAWEISIDEGDRVHLTRLPE